MVDFRDPTVVSNETTALVKFWHVVGGLYIWEFITTLDFEWSIIRGHRPYLWTIWIYSLTRVAALVATINDIIMVNASIRINCQASVYLELVPGYLALFSASFLLVLRTVAIWKKNRIVLAIAYSLWAINTTFLIQGLVRLHSEWEPTFQACIPHLESTKIYFIVPYATDVALLLIMFVGLLRLRCHKHRTFTMGRFLWNQGVIWLLISIISGVIPTVFICLNLNAPLDIMFQPLWMIAMSIAATRMYRNLVDYGSSQLAYESPLWQTG